MNNVFLAFAQFEPPFEAYAQGIDTQYRYCDFDCDSDVDPDFDFDVTEFLYGHSQLNFSTKVSCKRPATVQETCLRI